MARSGSRKPPARGTDGGPAKAEATALPEVLQFMRLLWAIVHALQMRSKEMSKVFGVTGPQRLVLRVVGLFPGVSPGALAEILHLHPSTGDRRAPAPRRPGAVTALDRPGDRRRRCSSSPRRVSGSNTSRKGTVERAVQVTLEQVAASDLAATEDVLSRLAACLGDPKRR